MARRYLEKPVTVKCTRPLVQRFYDMPAWDGDRDLKHRITRTIAQLVRSNDFRVASFASAYCKEDGKEYRVNGKHTSHVLAEMNGDFPKDLYANVERHECDTREDVAKLYATYDNPAHNRSNIDIYQAFAAAHPDLIGTPKMILSVCASGIAYSIWEDAIYQHQREERAGLLVASPEFVVSCAALLKGTKKAVGHVRRSPVVAAMFRTFSKSRKQSEEFWSLVRDGSGPKHTSPDRKLYAHLMQTSVGRGRGADKDKVQEQHREMYVKCIHAWNAWRGGNDTNLAYHSDKPTPPVK